MNATGQNQPPVGVLVSDFDGTMTQHDFYKLAIESLLPPDTPNHWDDYRAGRITHFEGLRRYFADIKVTDAEVRDVLRRMELDPQLPAAVARLRHAGWQVIVTSAGCGWYIQQLLSQAGVAIEVHSNPGQFVPGEGLLMELPVGSPYFSEQLGVDKAGVVRAQLARGLQVAFAGDGFPDADAARLVPAQRRYARGDLAETLRAEGLSFKPYATWSAIVDDLLS